MFRTLIFCALVLTGASSPVAQTDVQAGDIVPVDGTFLTTSEMVDTRAFIEALELKVEKLEAEVEHQAFLRGIETDAVGTLQGKLNDAFANTKKQKEFCDKELAEWEKRWKRTNQYIDKLEKRNGGGFWNNRAVTFVTDFLIFGGTVWAVSELRVD